MGEYKFRKTIFAVGQGGFSMGVLYDNDRKTPLYSYVYDCGSDQISALRREMNAAKSFLELDNEQIDTVFISHLDADHINGFDKLCELVDRRIKKVVLPYLDLEDRYYETSRALNTNTSGLFLDFLNNPIEWVRHRLPQAEIILLNPASDDDSDQDRVVIPEENKEPDNRHSISAGTQLSKDKLTIPKGLDAYTWMADLPSSSSLSKSPILLLAYIPPITKKKNSAFKNKLKEAGFGKLSIENLYNILCDPIERKKLRECYLSLASDHNIISMNLLVKSLGEVVETRTNSSWHKNYREFNYSRDYDHRSFNDLLFSRKKFGYLFTGDSKLSVNKYYSKWEKFYQIHFGEVQFISLPHHGSTHNFNRRILELIPNAIFIAQSGSNGYEHPSKDVVDEIFNSPYHSFIQISEDRETRLEQIYIIK